MIFDAPASAISTPMARAAPPAPKMITDLFLGSIFSVSDCRKPLPSVFSPISLSPLRTTQFTAPMIFADSLRLSRYLMTSTL